MSTSTRPELQELGFNGPHDAADRVMDLAIKDTRMGYVLGVPSCASLHGSQNALQRCELLAKIATRKVFDVQQGPHEVKHGQAQSPVYGVEFFPHKHKYANHQKCNLAQCSTCDIRERPFSSFTPRRLQ